MNPANLVSRGCNGKQFLESRWREGPQWLKLPVRMWPSTQFTIDEELVASETRKITKGKEMLKVDTHQEIQVMSSIIKSQSKEDLTERLST